MTITFTGDVAFKQKLFNVLDRNELNGGSAYSIAHATSNSRSGWSFGWVQYDLAQSTQTQGRSMFRDILENAQDAAGNFIVDDGNPATSRSNDLTIADLETKSRNRSPSALSPTEQNLINSALSSTYGITAIDNAVDQSLQGLINRAAQVINLTNGADRSFLESDFGRLFLCDYHNQYSITPGGPLERFVQGQTVVVFQGAIAKDGVLGADDLLNFYLRLQQPAQTPWDPLRRFSSIAEELQYAPA